MPGDGGIEDHQKGGGGHAHGGEQGVKPAGVAELEIDIGGAKAAQHQVQSDLLDQEDEGDPHQLVVGGNGVENLFEADGGRGLLHIVPPLPGAENGEGQEQRGQQADHQGDAAIGHRGAAADGQGAGGEHGDEDGGGGAADAGKESGPGGELVAGVGIGAEGRHHAPIGDVMHGVGDGVEEVHQTEKPHKAPAL